MEETFSVVEAASVASGLAVRVICLQRLLWKSNWPQGLTSTIYLLSLLSVNILARPELKLSWQI